MNLASKYPTRRAVLVGSAGAIAAAAAAGVRSSRAAAGTIDVNLIAAPTSQQIVPAQFPATGVWSFNGGVPGPEIRVRQGERMRIVVENRLDEETTVHWHGLRVPNAVDGVPHLTQRPIEPGERFVYEFAAPDAGTYWYHPHQRSSEQVGRGLYGPLIVEEPTPIQVDRDVTWVLDDWRLTDTAKISGDFGNRHDMSHNGRVGNTVTINGKLPEQFTVRSGERIRLRLINAANARIFGLDFADHAPVIIALDGQPVTPHRPDDGVIVLGPAMRADVVLDMTMKPGTRAAVADRFYRGLEYGLVDLVYADETLRERLPDWPIDLPANSLPEPNLAEAERHDVTFNGGMMGGMVMQQMGGSMGRGMSMRGMMHSGKIWFVNGVAAEGHVMDPMLTLRQDRSHVIAMTNATAWHHPIHLHGHSFRVIARDGKPTRHREWQDTVLMAPRERVEIAFVADNPGDWMFHCHILEHQAAGMMGVIRVTRDATRT